MSQMLNKAGGQNQSAGYHGVSQAHASLPSSTTVISRASLAGKTSALGLPSSPHYGQLSSLNQHHQQLLQKQLQPQAVQQQSLQIGAQGGAAGTPILGSGGLAYCGVDKRNLTSSQQMGSDTSSVAVGGTNRLDELSKNGTQVEVIKEEDDRIVTYYEENEEEKENTNLANTKEKTPMCLVNELARYNKVAHQYTLVDEQGPAHKKTFYVKLKLGEEEYSAHGESIKKAQHAAAAIALRDTNFSHPVPKPPRYIDGEVNNITPTVELNALAMKRGEPAIYKLIEPRNQQQSYQPANIDFRGMYNQRYHYGRPPRPFYVLLKVGQCEFIGDGPTRQAARHSAATKALKVLKNLPVPNDVNKPKTEDEEDSEDAMKSEISLVHEVALKRNLPVVFEVVRESGPPHLKNFVTKCTVGEMTTEAEGNSKKLSKKRAAELMLEELKRLPSLPTAILKPKLKTPTNKKKNRNIIKVQKADPSYGVGVNPISRLIQIMQAQKKKEPVYTLVAEKGLPRRREFVMQCQVEENVSEGVGPNKKLAKRNAAESMLQLLGFSRPSPQPSKPAIKSTQSCEGGGSSDKKVTFVDTGKMSSNGGTADLSLTSGSIGCQVVPGLLRLSQSSAVNVPGILTSSAAHTFMGQSEMSAVLSKAGSKAEKQAYALAESLNVSIKFEEFSKTNSSEFITRVTLSTNPPQVYHGTGPTRDSSRDAAALQMLLSITTSSVTHQAMKAAGDAGAVKTEPGVNSTLTRQLNSAGDQI